ncbi:MAG: hypothetical protein ABI435_08315, partial [Pseudolysinimonas sp.]
MSPDSGEDAEDWFAKFEREAREAAAANGVVPAQPGQPTQPAVPLVEPPAPVNPFDPTGFPQFEPAPQPATPSWEPMATQAMAIEPEPTQLNPVAEPTQALVRAPLRLPTDESDSALDSLFGDTAFREYQPGPDPNEAPFARRPSKDIVLVAGGEGGEPPPPHGLGTLQRVLIGVGGGLLAVIALIALFLVGTRLPDLLGPAPAVATPTPTPTPSMTALPIGPVEPGTYAWDELAGGECLDPYVDAWQEKYTVVDCADPHAAQMVYRAWFPESLPDSPDQTFPGAEALQTEITLLCSAPGIVDLA